MTSGLLGILAVVGRKKSGKTTISEYLISQFVREGFRVAAIKHIHHKFTIDSRGKDTWRLSKAGAEVVMSIAPSETAVIRRAGPTDTELRKLLKEVATEDMEIAVLEGFSDVVSKRRDVHKVIAAKSLEEAEKLIELSSHPVLAVIIQGLGKGGSAQSSKIPYLDLRSQLDDLYAIVRRNFPDQIQKKPTIVPRAAR